MVESEPTSFLNSLCKGHEFDWIFVIPSSIGEVASVCTLLKAFRKHREGKIHMVVHRRHEDVLSLFEGHFDSYQTAPLTLMRSLVSSRLIDPSEFSVGRPICLWAGQIYDGRLVDLHHLYTDYQGRGGVSFLDMYRYMLRLPWESEICRGKISSGLNEYAFSYSKKHGVEPGKSVIFFLGNNTNKPAPASLWESLASSFQEKGIKIFACISGAKFLPTKLTLDVPFLEMSPGLAVAVSRIAGRVVSGSNGVQFLSLVVDSPPRMDILLADRIIDEATNHFIYMNWKRSSCFTSEPELVLNNQLYREWLIKENASDGELHEIGSSLTKEHLS